MPLYGLNGCALSIHCDLYVSNCPIDITSIAVMHENDNKNIFVVFAIVRFRVRCPYYCIFTPVPQLKRFLMNAMVFVSSTISDINWVSCNEVIISSIKHVPFRRSMSDWRPNQWIDHIHTHTLAFGIIPIVFRMHRMNGTRANCLSRIENPHAIHTETGIDEWIWMWMFRMDETKE